MKITHSIVDIYLMNRYDRNIVDEEAPNKNFIVISNCQFYSCLFVYLLFNCEPFPQHFQFINFDCFYGQCVHHFCDGGDI